MRNRTHTTTFGPMPHFPSRACHEILDRTTYTCTTRTVEMHDISLCDMLGTDSNGLSAITVSSFESAVYLCPGHLVCTAAFSSKFRPERTSPFHHQLGCLDAVLIKVNSFYVLPIDGYDIPETRVDLFQRLPGGLHPKK